MININSVNIHFDVVTGIEIVLDKFIGDQIAVKTYLYREAGTPLINGDGQPFFISASFPEADYRSGGFEAVKQFVLTNYQLTEA